MVIYSIPLKNVLFSRFFLTFPFILLQFVMKVSYALLIFLFSVAFFSCNKTDTNDGITVAAKTILNVAYGPDPLQVMDIYLPASRRADSTKVLVMIHGG